MATRKNVVSPLALSAPERVRFSIGADEIRVADAWREAGEAEVSAAVQFFNVLCGSIADGGHEVDLRSLQPFKDGEKRTNEQQAQYDFAQRLFLVYKCGADLAAQLKDANVKGDAMLVRPGLKADGTPYKPMAKRAMRDTLLGKDWARFVTRLIEVRDAAEITAKIEAGEMKEGEAPKGAAKSTSSQADRGAKKLNELIKHYNRAADAEKGDGSISPDVAKKIAAYLTATFGIYGIEMPKG